MKKYNWKILAFVFSSVLQSLISQSKNKRACGSEIGLIFQSREFTMLFLEFVYKLLDQNIIEWAGDSGVAYDPNLQAVCGEHSMPFSL